MKSSAGGLWELERIAAPGQFRLVVWPFRMLKISHSQFLAACTWQTIVVDSAMIREDGVHGRRLRIPRCCPLGICVVIVSGPII